MSGLTTASSMPKAPKGIPVTDERHPDYWKAREAARALISAEEVKSDPKLVKQASQHLAQMANERKKESDAAKRASQKYGHSKRSTAAKVEAGKVQSTIPKNKSKKK